MPGSFRKGGRAANVGRYFTALRIGSTLFEVSRIENGRRWPRISANVAIRK